MRRLAMAAVLALSLVGAWPLAARADCASDCSDGCEGKPAAEWSKCMEPCLRQCLKDDPPAVPAPSPPKPVEPKK